VVKSHQSVDWFHYFKSIRKECPWSYAAYVRGEIDITEYTGQILPLGRYAARVYVVDAPNEQVEALAQALDHGQDEWLFSYPTYGEYATPVSVLIQQDRQKLKQLRLEQGANISADEKSL
jgi:histidinol-phosphate/aromatic aminotransferase/cobyric acid decarboxylase-like protein